MEFGFYVPKLRGHVTVDAQRLLVIYHALLLVVTLASPRHGHGRNHGSKVGENQMGVITGYNHLHPVWGSVNCEVTGNT